MSIDAKRIESILADCESWESPKGDGALDYLSNYEAFKSNWPDIKAVLEATKADIALPISEQPDGITGAKEIKPCPYVNGFSSDNSDVEFMLRKYDGYSDFVLFEEGKPARCFRFSAPKRESGGWQPIETAPKDGNVIIAWVTTRDGNTKSLANSAMVFWDDVNKEWQTAYAFKPIENESWYLKYWRPDVEQPASEADEQGRRG